MSEPILIHKANHPKDVSIVILLIPALAFLAIVFIYLFSVGKDNKNVINQTDNSYLVQSEKEPNVLSKQDFLLDK